MTPRPIQDSTPRVLFAGGGSGGHVCPAMAVVEALRRDDPSTEVLFLSTGRAVERGLLEGAGLPYVAVAPVRIDRRARHLPLLLAGAARGLGRAIHAVARFRPQVVLGLGGYGQVPGLIAARLLGIPYALFEPNRTAGRANRLLSGAAREVYIQWPGSEESLRHPERAVRTGTPIRREALSTLNPAAARRQLGLPADRSTLLIVGGSQGARALNEWAEHVFSKVRRPPFSVIHLTGNAKITTAMKAVYRRSGCPHRVLSFQDGMGLLYAAADLVLCRAGGATLAELTAAGLPSFVVPFPQAADDHQRANARALGQAALYREQSELGMQTFDEIAAFLADPEQRLVLAARSRALGHPRAAEDVARRLRRLAEAKAKVRVAA